MDDCRRHRIRRVWWEVRHGSWGLLLILSVHQAFVAAVLGIETYLFDYDGMPVPFVSVWPVVFALGALGAVDIYFRRLRPRVSLAQGLMLTAYGSRAMALALGGIESGWNSSLIVGCATWVLLMAATQRAWTEARDAL